jgi:hypothetical protein
MLLASLMWVFFHNNALAVLVNGEQVGIMEQSDVSDESFNKLITAKMREIAGNNLEIEDTIELAAVHSAKSKIENLDTVLTAFAMLFHTSRRL